MVASRRFLRAAALALGTLAGPAIAATTQPDIRTDDVDRFFKVYDAAQGKPTAESLQLGYLNPGSTGLHQFVDSRIGNADLLAAAIGRWPAAYADARQCAAAMPAVRAKLPAVFERLAEVYPPAVFPPVTVVVGRNNTGGTTTAAGVVVGLEAICRSTWMQPDVGERLVHLIAHEYVHVQQPGAQSDPPPGATLLFLSLLEGGAEFVGELTSGEVSNSHLAPWTRGHECQIERAFESAAPGTDAKQWLYNGAGTPDKPGDLGYWVGYRIAKAYYAQATDKKQAVADILNVEPGTAAGLLRRSGWTPETDCQAKAPT